MRKRDGLIGLAVFAAGTAAGAAVEELLYRRVMGRPDPEASEPIGGVPGKTIWVEASDGTRLHTRVYGPDEADATFVFAHGVCEANVLWHYQVRDLRADGRFRLVAYDARGHGASGPARGPKGTSSFNGETLALDLASVIEQTTTGPVITVGHSLGGMTGLAFLLAEDLDRKRVAGAVFVNTTFTAQIRGWRSRGKTWQRAIERAGDAVRRAVGDDAERIDRLRAPLGDLALIGARLWLGTDASPRHIAVAYRMFASTPSETLAAAMDLHDYDVHELLKQIDVPTLVIGGSRDIITPAWLSREIARSIPESELVILEGCGHMAPLERHDEIAAYLRKFADRVIE